MFKLLSAKNTLNYKRAVKSHWKINVKGTIYLL